MNLRAQKRAKRKWPCDIFGISFDFLLKRAAKAAYFRLPKIGAAARLCAQDTPVVRWLNRVERYWLAPVLEAGGLPIGTLPPAAVPVALLLLLARLHAAAPSVITMTDAATASCLTISFIARPSRKFVCRPLDGSWNRHSQSPQFICRLLPAVAQPRITVQRVKPPVPLDATCDCRKRIAALPASRLRQCQISR